MWCIKKLPLVMIYIFIIGVSFQCVETSSSQEPGSTVRIENNESANIDVVNSPTTSSIFPNDGCIMKEGNECLQYVDTNLPQLCEDWLEIHHIENYDWIANDSECMGQELSEQLLSHFQKRINWFRALNYQPVIDTIVNPNLLVKTQYSELGSHQNMSEEEITALCNITTNDIESVTNWELNLGKRFLPHKHLETFFKANTFSGNYNALFFYRHIIMGDMAEKIDFYQWKGSLAISIHEKQELKNHLPITIYPGIGEVPYEQIMTNFNMEEPITWSVGFNKLLNGVVILKVFQHGEQYNPKQRIEVTGDYKNYEYMNRKIFTFTPTINISPNTLYELEISFQSASRKPLHAYIYLKDCGYTFPSECNLLDDDACPLPNTHCMHTREPDHIDDFNIGKCVWSGPVAPGKTCAYGSNDSCQQGFCGLLSNQMNGDDLCYTYCSTEVDHPKACDVLCDSQMVAFTNFEGYPIQLCR